MFHAGTPRRGQHGLRENTVDSHLGDKTFGRHISGTFGRKMLDLWAKIARI